MKDHEPIVYPPPKPSTPSPTPSQPSRNATASTTNNASGDVMYKVMGFMLLGLLSIIVVFLFASLMFWQSIADDFESWQNPNGVARSFSSYNANKHTEYMTESGLMNPVDNLNDPLLKSRAIVINSGIQEHTAWRISRKLLYLNAQNPRAPIDLYLSTNGGWYTSAFSIIDTFQSITAPVNVHCLGGCYSSGALIMAAATGERIAGPNAHFSLHIRYGSYDDEDGEESKEYAAPDDRVNQYYQQHTKIPQDWFPLEDDRDYYLNAQQALEFGLIDRIGKASFAPKFTRPITEEPKKKTCTKDNHKKDQGKHNSTC